MRWLGPMLHLLYPPTPDPAAREFAALLEQRQEHLAAIEASSRRLEALAADPVDAAVQSIIEDL